MRLRGILIASLVVLGLVEAAAQPQKAPRVGVMLMQPVDHPFAQAFRKGMRELGYVEGRNVQVEYRSAEGDASRLAGVASELVRLNVDVIVAGGGSIGPRVARKVTSTIPIVFPVAADPVGAGLVRSLARPGGNMTGLALLEAEMSAKRFQLLSELLPKVERVAVIADPSMGGYAEGVRASEKAAVALGLKLHLLSPRNPSEVEGAFNSARKAGAQAVVVQASSQFSTQAKRLVGYARQYRLVTIWESRVYTDVGGLISYGHDIADMYRGAARYVDKILKGAQPAELPVEQGAKLDLVINLRTAKDLGVTVPAPLLVRADQVIH